MQTQWTRNTSESEIIARLLAQMEAAKRQATQAEDSSDELETWEWEGGATLNRVMSARRRERTIPRSRFRRGSRESKSRVGSVL